MGALTYEDIKTAADDLKATGIAATIRNVRDSLNHGSYSTISPFLLQWKKENNELPAKESAKDFPGPLKTLLMNYINSEKAELIREVEQLEADVQALTTESRLIGTENAMYAESIRTTEADLNQIKGELKYKNEMIERLYTQVESEKAATMRASVEAHSAEKELAKAKEIIAKLSDDRQSCIDRIKDLEESNRKLTDSLVEKVTIKNSEDKK